ncbi:trigger factor [Methylocucumis oryzae]|uniref:trigger factor n=1 Tax=Methylocucumis oryzae TaxID=1632867 RepID=UPI000A825F20
MQVIVEKTSELSRKMTVSVPESVVQEKMAQRLKALARHVRVDGFRPGKAPQHIVKKLYDSKVREEISNDLIQSTYPEALKNEALEPASYPHIDASYDADGFRYVATFEVYPDISLDNLAQLRVTRPVATVEEADIDAMLEKLKLQRVTWNKVERASQAGDRIIIDFSGEAEGENFTNGLIQDYTIGIGDGKMIPGFEDNLIGLAEGEAKSFELTFPEDYGVPKLAGQLARFELTVKAVEASVIPEINEEFIKSFGIEEGTLESFRQDVRNNLERELNKKLQELVKDAAMNAVLEIISVTPPNALVDNEVEHLMKPYIETAKRQKIKLEDLHGVRDSLQDQAKRRVSLGLNY